MPSIEARNITVSYGKLAAVRDVSFEVAAGEIVALIGSNGAGKSTTLKALMGLKTLTSGALYLDGERIDQTNAAARTRMGFSLSPEGRRLFPRMTVYENLQVGAHTVKKAAERRRTLDQVYTLFPRVAERHRQLAGSLSGGEQQMVAIGRAMMSQPQILMLDEPSLGIAPMVISEIFSVIQTLNRETGISVILVEQNAHLALQLAKNAYVLDQGTIIRSGTGEEMLHDPFVQKGYLGI